MLFLGHFYFEVTGFYSPKPACFTGTSQFQETENVGSGQTGVCESGGGQNDFTLV